MVELQKRKIRWAISLFLVMLYFSGLPAQAQYGGGSGEPNNPYLIYTAEQMNEIGLHEEDWDKHFKLMADIDLSSYTGTDFNIIGYYISYPDVKPFTGVFDGNGHTISNFIYTSTDRDRVGLFGYVEGGTIKDLGLIDPNVDAGTGEYVGSLVGSIWEGTITGCYVDGGSVSGSCTHWRGGVGGLVGENSGTITDCYSSANVSGVESVGGLVGTNRGTITNCYSTGSVTGVDNVGGLVGDNVGTITNCYSVGAVTGTNNVGGLVGLNYTRIINCYSISSVTGAVAVGGLVGLNDGGLVYTCFWDTEASGQTISAGGTGKTTAQMQMASTFIVWGCEPVWTIDEGADYPRIVWENKPGETIYATSPCYGGSGTPADPYLIYTAEQLNAIGLFPSDWDKHFKLMADIDLGGYTGTDFNIIGVDWENPFTGVFDGNGHTISNFSYTCIGKNYYIGLFGYVEGEDAEIKDLGLVDPNVNAGTVDHHVGSLVCDLRSGTITNCNVQGGSVSGHWVVGGLVGLNDGTITNCYASATVSGRSRVGGLVGVQWNGTMTNCYATGSISGETTVGGLVGSNWGTITNCYVEGGSVSGGGNVGGLVGYNSKIISNCYATGSVSGASTVGGLVGSNSGTTTKCYSVGSVTGTQYVGGLVGHGGATNSFWDIETSGQVSSDGGTGLTTAEMHEPNTFMEAGWDFIHQPDGPHDIWAEPPDGGYPILWCQLSPLPPLPTFSGGIGEPNEPYIISSAEDLNSIGHNPRLMDAHFKLINDIDLAGVEFFIIGNELFPFAGVFDGNGKTISNFSYTSTDKDYTGLFGYVRGAEIKDLGLIDANVDAGTGDYVGSLVGVNSGTITNCYATGSVSGESLVGGLVGHNGYEGHMGSRYGTISNCYSSGSVSGVDNVGGLVGNNVGWVYSSFWDIETSGQATSDGGTGKTTAEMHTESTFTDAGWDFLAESVNGTEDIWSICEGTNYPRLVWQIPAGDFVCPDGITIEDFVFFTEYWRDDNCDLSNDYCEGTDLDFSGTVDEADLEILIENWLESSELEN